MSRNTITDVRLTCESLFDVISQQVENGADLDKQCISVSRPGFRIMFVPAGSEQVAKMELNERY